MRTRTVKMLITISLTTLLIFLAFFIFLMAVSPGKPGQITDQSGNIVKNSISEKTFLLTGGVKQGMFIRSRNPDNPVLLFVHGGPSFSEFFLAEKYPTGLEDFFTVCYWEQRGGGLSSSRDMKIEDLTLEQLEADAIEVVGYLRKRFRKEKIFILAHSGGTAFALRAIKNHPELFEAYIGVAQITSQAESEKSAYRYITETYTAQMNTGALTELRKFPVNENDSMVLPFFNSAIRDKSMHELGIGTMRNMKSVMMDVFLEVWLCKAYTIKEKWNIWYSKFNFVNKSKLREQIILTDFSREITSVGIPVYLISGRYDMTVNYELSRNYLRELVAPVKGFYTFDNSAHSPIFEEPEKFLDIMIRDVLNKDNQLAD